LTRFSSWHDPSLSLAIELDGSLSVDLDEPLDVGSLATRRHGEEHGELVLRESRIAKAKGMLEANAAHVKLFFESHAEGLRRACCVVGATVVADDTKAGGGGLEQRNGVHRIADGERASLAPRHGETKLLRGKRWQQVVLR
jgi:hypothetical protein